MNTLESAATATCLTGVARLTHWGVIRAQGEDAVKFLQGQLTNDLTSLTVQQARLAGFCSAKGRLQASFIVWKDVDDALLLACAADLLAPTLKRLSMFVMRAKCRLDDATVDRPLWGVTGEAVPPALAAWEVGSTPDGSRIIGLPEAAGLARAICIDGAPAGVPPLPLDTWRWLEVQSGIPVIEAATVEQFVPQMLNYELLGGVDFKKGCYPGQEVVARSHYRGTIKRRSFLFDVDAPVATAGQEVFHSASPDQPAGQVVNAAPRPGGHAGCSALVEVKLAARIDGSLHLGSVTGPLLQPRAMPYAVPLEPVDEAV